MSIIDYFDRTAIINLPERADRRAETRDEFRRIGWPIENEKVDFFTALRPKTPAGFPNQGVRGCFLSHMNVIKKAKHDNLANILVMEDDIAFISDIDKIAADALQALDHTNWGFLYLGHEYTSDPSSGTRLEKITEPLLFAHFYAVNSVIFDRFLEFLEQVLERPPGHPDGGPMHYDGALSTFRMQNRDINTFAIIPSLGYQRSSRTDLHSLSFWDNWAILNPLTSRIRRLKNAIKRSTK
jgi:hypothetical protein